MLSRSSEMLEFWLVYEVVGVSNKLPQEPASISLRKNIFAFSTLFICSLKNPYILLTVSSSALSSAVAGSHRSYSKVLSCSFPRTRPRSTGSRPSSEAPHLPSCGRLPSPKWSQAGSRPPPSLLTLGQETCGDVFCAR